MRIAVIDCGTNTFNLLVVELQNSSFKRIYTSKIPVKLGEGGINNKVIHKIPFKRGVDALVKFKNELNKLAVVEIYAFATSAIRDAENGIDFKKEVLIQSGIEINIIDGNKEAELIYKGNKLAMDLGTGPSLIMDIGGGSTEFIIGNKENILWKKSYRLGAARMLEKFNPSDPITEKQIQEIYAYLNEELNEIKPLIDQYKPVELIGSSGAFDSVVEMIHGQLGGEKFEKEKTEYNVDLKNYNKIAEMVVQSTLAQRKIMKGLVEMRVDMMVVSCLLINFTLQTFNLQKMRVSTYSLKEGALHEIIENKGI
ncbi:MAG: exopolyphosphatase [Sphingobacteriaceae bacterium]|nr:exopolyphosphatase [Sphingobacteriaceae bacterium]